ncbi:hypothetical protein GQ43DRAFT_363185 [Delitschia confertaspora ATCC 74209]|uniref:Uncharacterized protein n=1 Tax=Delitschia confertaspora ATCC 74209 TaxID=1513339 RepID=A0A9P4MTC2_9PLEO|nr:hypothetical protein GQ43DRAFT_363185 [Delitschia confertaspora ATCC 74209]
MNYKFWLTKKRPRPKLARRPVVKAAKQLHESIFTEFSNRDDRTLKSLCTSGLLTTFRKQLASLPKDEMMSWRLLKHLSRPRIVSNRATPLPLPGDSEAALRQVVVRLHTRQLVEKWETQKKAQVNSVEKDVVEYVVLQRIMRRGKEEDWKVWGFANETTYQELKEEQKRIEQMSEWEARHG